MRYASVLLAVSCLLSAVNAQLVETTIRLPDSIAGVTATQSLVYDSASNIIYAGGGPEDYGVMVVDCATNRRIARIETGYDVRSLCYNSQDNKVYAANYYDGNVSVIDGVTNQVLATVAFQGQPMALCYNAVANKVYCVYYDAGSMTVVDGSSNEVLAAFALSCDAHDLRFNPQNNKVYCALQENRLRGRD